MVVVLVIMLLLLLLLVHYRRGGRRGGRHLLTRELVRGHARARRRGRAHRWLLLLLRLPVSASGRRVLADQGRLLLLVLIGDLRVLTAAHR